MDHSLITNTHIELLAENRHLFGANDRAFFQRIFSREQDIYLKRLRAIGFDCGHRILDAGCGFGQWVLQMAKGYKEVYGVDISSERLFILSRMTAKLNLGNISLLGAELTKLPFKDNYFPNIFCYGALFLTDWRAALREFYRLLVDGGKLYFTANDLGWYVNLWLNRPNAAEDYDPREYAAVSFYNTSQYERTGVKPLAKGDLIMQREDVLAFLKDLGYTGIQVGAEGCLNVGSGESIPFFKGEYSKLPGVYEIIAVKQNR